MTPAEVTESQGGSASAKPRGAFANALCAVDGKAGGFLAVEQAAALVGPAGQLTLLAVTSFKAGGEYRSPAIGPAQAKKIMDRAVRIAEEAGVRSTVAVDPATPPSEVILDWSARHDLLALGAPNTSWVGSMFIAGVADTALGAFTTPLLAARARPVEGDRGDRIIVASDGREGSDELLELGLRLAHAQGTDMMLVHAIGHESRERRERIEEQGRRLAQMARGDQEVRVERGHAHDVIIDTAASTGASLVLMGSRRLEGLRAIGSVSRRVVHEAPCSVLLIPPEQLER